jgi:hypothetical protein
MTYSAHSKNSYPDLGGASSRNCAAQVWELAPRKSGEKSCSTTFSFYRKFIKIHFALREHYLVKYNVVCQGSRTRTVTSLY